MDELSRLKAECAVLAAENARLRHLARKDVDAQRRYGLGHVGDCTCDLCAALSSPSPAVREEAAARFAFARLDVVMAMEAFDADPCASSRNDLSGAASECGKAWDAFLTACKESPDEG